MTALADVDGWLYRLIQLAIREAVASRTLDEVLAAKGALDAELRASVRERIGDSGIELLELGVKDVILPGEIRELVNKVVEAERTAKANLIRRQEETAATRSLLNTAKLMEDNPLLLRLKELEVARAAGGEGRPDRSPRRRDAGPRCAADAARAPQGGRACLAHDPEVQRFSDKIMRKTRRRAADDGGPSILFAATSRSDVALGSRKVLVDFERGSSIERAGTGMTPSCPAITSAPTGRLESSRTQTQAFGSSCDRTR